MLIENAGRQSVLGKILRWASLSAPLFGVSTLLYAQDGFVDTNTAAFPAEGAVANGTLPDTEPLHIAVSLKLRSREQLDQFIERIHTRGDTLFGKRLTRDQFAALYAPTADQVRAVSDFLAAAGFTNISVAPNHLLISADGSAASVRSAFATELMQYQIDGRRAFANTKPARVPRRLGSIVHAVLGLQNVEHARPMLVMQQPDRDTSLAVHGHDPLEFQTIYNVGNIPSASQATVAIVAQGDLTQTLADLSAYESKNSLPQVSPTVVQVGSGAYNDTSGMLEWNLDSQSVTAMAGEVKALIFYDAPTLSDAHLTEAYNRAVSDNLANVINVSLGECERIAFASGAIASDDQIFAQAVAQGQTFVTSSGDGGARTGCFSHDGVFVQVSYPASSPYVVAVGGTRLDTTMNGGYGSETAWTKSGGGVSRYEAIPTWQKAVLLGGKRGLPDVAFDADPASGAIVLVSNISMQVGGTSLSAPLFTGLLARAQSANNNTLGFAAPAIYAVAKSSPSVFHDVKSGSNGWYHANRGWDLVTGFGSPDIAAFINAN
jgi:pseudomonalisin/xanthomonalisin